VRAISRLLRRGNHTRHPPLEFLGPGFGSVRFGQVKFPEIFEPIQRIESQSPSGTVPLRMLVQSNRHVTYIWKKGAAGFEGIQSLEDLRNNWNRLLDAAELTDEERKEAVERFNAKVSKIPGTEM